MGKVVKIDSDGDVAVAFGNKAWVFNPACCEPASGQKVYEISGAGKKGEAGGGNSSGHSSASSSSSSGGNVYVVDLY